MCSRSGRNSRGDTVARSFVTVRDTRALPCPRYNLYRPPRSTHQAEPGVSPGQSDQRWRSCCRNLPEGLVRVDHEGVTSSQGRQQGHVAFRSAWGSCPVLARRREPYVPLAVIYRADVLWRPERGILRGRITTPHQVGSSSSRPRGQGTNPIGNRQAARIRPRCGRPRGGKRRDCGCGYLMTRWPHPGSCRCMAIGAGRSSGALASGVAAYRVTMSSDPSRRVLVICARLAACSSGRSRQHPASAAAGE